MILQGRLEDDSLARSCSPKSEFLFLSTLNLLNSKIVSELLLSGR